MNISRYTLIIVVCCCLPHIPVKARSGADSAQFTKHEFVISDGLMSFDQWRGLLVEAPRYTNHSNLPRRMTGALFLTYRHYLRHWLAVGATIGVDNQSGELADSYNGGSRRLGAYRREAYTLGAEISWVYDRDPTGEWPITKYGYAGVGYTTGCSDFRIDPAFHKEPNTEHIGHFNLQVTPIAWRTGGRVGKFLELGFGYKGLICVGVSYTPR